MLLNKLKLKDYYVNNGVVAIVHHFNNEQKGHVFYAPKERIKN